MAQPDEPEQAPPWREEGGPPPEKWIWPPHGRPALYVRYYGQWMLKRQMFGRAGFPLLR